MQHEMVVSWHEMTVSWLDTTISCRNTTSFAVIYRIQKYKNNCRLLYKPDENLYDFASIILPGKSET